MHGGDLSRTAPLATLHATYDRIDAAANNGVLLSTVPRAQAIAVMSAALARQAAGEPLPLLGRTVAIKDNIDLAGLPTTAACPAYAYQPAHSATAVQRLVAAGAIPIGKANLDQFATGLNGTRTPHPVPPNPFDPARVPGGSSSGSAVAVATGLADVALGTDTAGSGRVPAAFNNLVGLKPTRGLVSTSGVVPACRSLDCVSVFAGTAIEALATLRVLAGFDPADPYSRPAPPEALQTGPEPAGLRFGVPDRATLSPCDKACATLFEAAAAKMEALGGTRVPIDLTAFAAAASLLYAGPWVAERWATLRPFAEAHPEALDPAVRDVLLSGTRYDAADAFAAQHRLAELARQTEAEWARMDVLLLPTAPTLPTLAAMRADPVGLNAVLGTYTNFVNLLDLAAIAVPAGFTPTGLPFGVTLVGRAFTDGHLALLGDRLHRALATPAARLGATDRTLAATAPLTPDHADTNMVDVAVVGAHLAGEPLNHQLTGRGGTLLGATNTATGYSLYALPGTTPPRPGLVRDGGAGGIAVEVWRLPVAGFGALVAGIPAPLGIGTVQLNDGTAVPGFLCEAHALHGAEDITHHGGWRAYLRRTAS